MDRLYGYGVGITAGLATIGYLVAPALAGWLALLIVLVWAARRTVPNDEGRGTRDGRRGTGDEGRRTRDEGRRTNEYGEVWHGNE